MKKDLYGSDLRLHFANNLTKKKIDKGLSMLKESMPYLFEKKPIDPFCYYSDRLKLLLEIKEKISRT